MILRRPLNFARIRRVAAPMRKRRSHAKIRHGIIGLDEAAKTVMPPWVFADDIFDVELYPDSIFEW
jgi:hypothetical protein